MSKISSSIDIAYFIRSMHGGGAEKATLHLLSEFAKRGLKVDLLVARAEGSYLKLIPPEINLIDLSTDQVFLSFPKLIRYLQWQRPKALIASLHYPAEMALWARELAKVPTKVIVIEQNTLSVEAKNSSQLSVRLSPLAARLSYPLADRVVAISKGVAVDLAKTICRPFDKIDIIHGAIITPNLFQQAQEPIDHPWFEAGEPPVVIALGRLHKQKDFPTLIHAFAKVRQTLLARLMILGVGPEEDNLKSLIHNLGIEKDVEMPGFFLNPYPYVARAGVFVLSSAWEGLSNILVETLALGTPIVSTDCPSGPSEVLNGGKYGLLVPVGDSDAMAQSLIKALGGKGKKAEPEWIEKFTAEYCTQRFLELLQID